MAQKHRQTVQNRVQATGMHVEGTAAQKNDCCAGNIKSSVRYLEPFHYL
jgi:hypothetical protein